MVEVMDIVCIIKGECDTFTRTTKRKTLEVDKRTSEELDSFLMEGTTYLTVQILGSATNT